VRPTSRNLRFNRFLCTAAPRTRAPPGDVFFRGFGTTNPILACETGEAETKTSR
jgi:hypothetical protein